MNDKFEATFVVDLPPEAVWTALARRDRTDHTRTLSEDSATQVWLPGWEATCDVIES